MSSKYSSHKGIPLYASCIINIKQKARVWGISSYSFDLSHTHISSQIRVHGAYGSYNDVEKLWHIEFYMWGKYFGAEPFPFPFPSTTMATLISAANPAPSPTGPRATYSIPVANPFPPLYVPGAPRSPVANNNTGRFSPAAGSGSRANLSRAQHHQGSSPGSGLRREFKIRGLATRGRLGGSGSGGGGSPRYSNIGQAYNNRWRGGAGNGGRGVSDPGSEGVEGGDGEYDERGDGNDGHQSRHQAGHQAGHQADYQAGGSGEGQQRNGRSVVHAARRQLKISRRTGERH